jgi:hypothetical protein
VYGESLDLSPFMAEQVMDEGPATYTLSGVIVHLDQVRHSPEGLSICCICLAVYECSLAHRIVCRYG